MALTIAVELLTGSYDAAEVDDRENAEWPVSAPARVYCALVSAARNEADRAALRWLEAQPAPLVLAAGDWQDATAVVVCRGERPQPEGR